MISNEVSGTESQPQIETVTGLTTFTLPSGYRFIGLVAASATSINKIASFLNEGELVRLINMGTVDITLEHIDQSRATNYEMCFTAGADVVLRPGDEITLRRDSVGRWIEQSRGRSVGQGFYEIDNTVTLDGVSTDLTADVPSGAVIESVQAKIVTAAVAGGTSVKVGIGPTSDPDKYGITTNLTDGQAINRYPSFAQLGSAEDVQVNACATAGGIGDTGFSAGVVRVRIRYKALTELHD